MQIPGKILTQDLFPPVNPVELKVLWILRNTGGTREAPDARCWSSCARRGAAVCGGGSPARERASGVMIRQGFRSSLGSAGASRLHAGTPHACRLTAETGGSASADRCPPDDIRAPQKHCEGWEWKKHRQGWTKLRPRLPNHWDSKPPRLRLGDFHPEEVPSSTAFFPGGLHGKLRSEFLRI